MKKTEDVLRTAIFEATEVRVPTCFVIVNQKLSPISQPKAVR
jgi:hypothetical protein